MKFIVQGLGLLGKTYETLKEAQANKYDHRKNKMGEIKVEMSENEYISLVNEIHGLKGHIQEIQKEHQRKIGILDAENKEQLKNMKQQYQSQIEKLEHRINGMRAAVRKWRVKAGVDEPAESELAMAERRIIRNKKGLEWQYLEHRTIPVEKNPHLAREVWVWLEERKQDQYVERIYFHQSFGWVAIGRVKW